MADRVVTKTSEPPLVCSFCDGDLSISIQTSDQSPMWRWCCLDINQSTVFESYQGSPVIQPKYSNTEGPEQPVPAG